MSGLFITDAELYELLRVTKVNGPSTVLALEMEGLSRPFPKPRPPFKHRYLAEVVQWLNEYHKIRAADGLVPAIDGVENFNAAPAKARRIRRPGAQVEPRQGSLGGVLGGAAGRRETWLSNQDPKVVAFERGQGAD